MLQHPYPQLISLQEGQGKVPHQRALIRRASILAGFKPAFCAGRTLNFDYGASKVSGSKHLREALYRLRVDKKRGKHGTVDHKVMILRARELVLFYAPIERFFMHDCVNWRENKQGWLFLPNTG